MFVQTALYGAYSLTPRLESHHPWSDLVRLALILIPGIFIVGITLVVLVKYARTWWTDRALANAQGVKSRWRGLLPSHVVWVSASYVGLVMMPLTSAISRFREPLYSWPRSLFYSFFMLAGVYALISVVRHQRAKMISIETISYGKHGDEGGSTPVDDETDIRNDTKKG